MDFELVRSLLLQTRLPASAFGITSRIKASTARKHSHAASTSAQSWGRTCAGTILEFSRPRSAFWHLASLDCLFWTGLSTEIVTAKVVRNVSTSLWNQAWVSWKWEQKLNKKNKSSTIIKTSSYHSVIQSVAEHQQFAEVASVLSLSHGGPGLQYISSEHQTLQMILLHNKHSDYSSKVWHPKHTHC